MLAGATVSVTAGLPSSSRMVSVAFVTVTAPLPPEAVAVTATLLSGASVALSTAVAVTRPVLAVCPAATISVVPASVKSAEGETVIVTASVETGEMVAVTVADPPPSVALSGDSASRAVMGSLSVMVAVPAASDATVAFTAPLRLTITVSSASFTASSVTATSMLPLAAPGARVRVPAAMAV